MRIQKKFTIGLCVALLLTKTRCLHAVSFDISAFYAHYSMIGVTLLKK